VKEANDFPELMPAVQSILAEYKSKRLLSRLARELGFSKNRLSEILCGKRKLTLYYVLKFIEAKAVTVDQLFENLKINDLPEHKRIMAKRFLLDPRVVDVLDSELQELIKDAITRDRIDDFRTSLKSVLNIERKKAMGNV
jgi:transcriptional regulator with XRE-family HTH domain